MNLFSTDRLDVRRLTVDDVEAMHAIYGDLATMRFVGDSNRLTAENCRYWVEVTDRNFEKRGYGMVAVIERETGDLIGCCGVVHPNQQEEPEVKYAFRKDKWGMGYATEAIIGLVAYATDVLKITDLIATVHPDHHGSQNVLRKAGFVHDRDRTNPDNSITQLWRRP